MEILTVWRWLRGVEFVMKSLVVTILEIHFGKEYDYQVLTFFKKLLHDVEVLLVLVLACRILAVSIGMAVEKVLFVAVIQFTASYDFRLIALVGFLEEQPQFVGIANATYTVSEGGIHCIRVKRENEESSRPWLFNVLLCSIFILRTHCPTEKQPRPFSC